MVFFLIFIYSAEYIAFIDLFSVIKAIQNIEFRIVFCTSVLNCPLNDGVKGNFWYVCG